MCSPREHRLAALRRRRDSRASSAEQHQRLVGDPVLREVEVEAGAVGDQPLAALGVGGEEVAQVALARSGGVVAPASASPGRRARAAARLDASAQLDDARAREEIESSSSSQDLSKDSLPSLLEAFGERVDVDPGLAELASGPRSASPPSAGSGSPTSPWSAKASQRLLGHRVDRERRGEGPRCRGRRRRRGPWSRCSPRAVAAAGRPRSARRSQRSESSSSR